MPIPLFGKLISGTGQPYADADQVAVDASGFDGNLETTDTTLQAVAQKVDDLNIAGGGSQQLVELTGSSLTITSANLSTYNGNILYLPEGGSGQYDINLSPSLNISHIDVANFNTSRNIVIDTTTSATINGVVSYTVRRNSGIRVIREPSATGYQTIFTHLDSLDLEGVQDAVAAMITGSTYDDNAGTLTLPASGVQSVTSQLTGNILQTTYQFPAPASPTTTNIDLSSIAGGSGTVDASGTPTANQIATWVDADTIQGVDRLNIGQVAFAQTSVGAGETVSIDASQANYNAYRNTEAVTTITSQSATVLRLPRLGTRQGWMRTGDIFIYTNSASSTRSIILQTANTGDRFPGTDTQQSGTAIAIDPGQSVAVRVPARGRIWERTVYTSTATGSGEVSGSAGDMMGGVSPNPFLQLDNWKFGLDNYLEYDGDTRIGRSYTLEQETVREHLSASRATGTFYSGTFTDDQSMIEWFRTILPNQEELDLGDTADTIQHSLDTGVAKSWLNTNVTASYNFIVNNNDSAHTITSAALNAPNRVRLGLNNNPHPIYHTVGNYVNISGASSTILNGNFRIAEVLTSHIVIEVTGATTAVASNTGGNIVQIWYGSMTPDINIAGRYVPFYLFLDPARSQTAQATVATHAWDHNAAADAVTQWDILYNAPVHRGSVFEVEGNIMVQDVTDNALYAVPAGSKQAVRIYNNVGSDYTYRVYLDTTQRYMYLRGSALSEYYLDIDASSLNPGESKRYTIAAAAGTSIGGFGYYALAIGRQGSIGTFDNGLQVCYIPPNGHIELLAYNDGTNSGVRILSPIQRTRETNPAYQIDTNLTQTIADRLPISNTGRNQNTDEDPQGFLIGLGGASGVPANRIKTKAACEIDATYEVTVKFNGTEGSGLLFVPVLLSPYVNGVVQTHHRIQGHLLFSRGGQSGTDAPKFGTSMVSNFRYQAALDDEIEWRLSFGTFPTGYSISDLQIQNAVVRVTAQLNLK